LFLLACLCSQISLSTKYKHMKRILSFLFITLCALPLCAQRASSWRGGMDGGYARIQNYGGLALHINGGYNLTDNMNLGLRINAANFEHANLTAGSYLATYHYYFNKGENSYAPFVGGGLGVCVGSNEGKIGGMITAGIEFIPFLRLMLEYNILPNQSSPIVANESTKPNSYWAITFGFYFCKYHWGDTRNTLRLVTSKRR
jgi:hypothetical protein